MERDKMNAKWGRGQLTSTCPHWSPHQATPSPLSPWPAGEGLEELEEEITELELQPHLLPTPVSDLWIHKTQCELWRDLLCLDLPHMDLLGIVTATLLLSSTSHPAASCGQPSPKTQKEVVGALAPACQLQSHHIAAGGSGAGPPGAAAPSPRPALFPALLLLLPPEHRRPEACHLNWCAAGKMRWPERSLTGISLPANDSLEGTRLAAWVLENASISLPWRVGENRSSLCTLARPPVSIELVWSSTGMVVRLFCQFLWTPGGGGGYCLARYFNCVRISSSCPQLWALATIPAW